MAEILWEEFIVPLNLSCEEASYLTGLNDGIIDMIIDDDNYPITQDIADALAKGFNTSSQFWVNIYNNSKGKE